MTITILPKAHKKLPPKGRFGRLHPGQLWKANEDCGCCGYPPPKDATFLLLSCDRDYKYPEDRNYYWKTAYFSYGNTEHPFFGAQVKYFTEGEVLKNFSYTGMLKKA